METFPEHINDFLFTILHLPLDVGRADVNVALFQCFKLEKQLRHLFSQSRDLPLLHADPYIGLIKIFNLHNDILRARPRLQTEDTYVWTFPDGSTEAFPGYHLLPLNDELIRRQGDRAIVPNLQCFQRNFEVFTHGALSRLENWNNIVVAGGAILGCLSPPLNRSNSNFELNELYQSPSYQNSDIDLFLYGLTHEEALQKMIDIYDSIQRTLPFGMVCVRRAYTITIYTSWPIRPIQIIMRLYISPAEILAGFDVDSSCCLYNGVDVYVNPRALAALICQSNTVDMTRRSPSYEIRLFKYSERGFELYYPKLRREDVDHETNKLYNQDLPSYPQGLPFLLVGEMERRRPNHYRLLHPHRQPRVPRARRLPGYVTIETADLKELLFDNNYDYFRIPYGEGMNATRIIKMVQAFDRKANSRFNRANWNRSLHRHAVSCPDPQTDEETMLVMNEPMYIRGRARFIELDPGRQMIGSFNPITLDDWSDSAYKTFDNSSTDTDGDISMVENNLF